MCAGETGLPHSPQELLHPLGDKVTEAQPERMTLKPCQKGKVFPEAWKPGKAGPKSTLQTFRGPQRPKVKQNSGCFRKTKMDRIDSVSGLGCKGKASPGRPFCTLAISGVTGGKQSRGVIAPSPSSLPCCPPCPAGSGGLWGGWCWLGVGQSLLGAERALHVTTRGVPTLPEDSR